MRLRFNLLAVSLLALTLLIPGLSHADRAVPGDYDGDGRSDIAVARVINGFWTWFIRHADGNERAAITFGLAGDTLLARDADGDGRFEPGVIQSRADGLHWVAMSAEGGIAVDVPWGLPGDASLTGYFDSDDALDIAVVRPVNGLLNWFLKTSSGTELVGEVWGNAGNSVFTGDLNADGIDEIIAVGPEPDGNLGWYARTADANRIPLPVVRWGLAGHTPLAPADVDGDGIDDFTVIANIGGYLVAYIRMNAGDGSVKSTREVSLGLAGDKHFFGNYFSGFGASLGVYRNTQTFAAHYLDVDGTSTNMIAVAFGLAGDTLVMPNGNATDEKGIPSSSGPGLSSVCAAVIPVSKGILWKPSSDHSGPPREGRPALLFSSGRPSSGCLIAYASNGVPVSSLGVYEFGGKYGARFYTGWGCGDQDHGSEMALQAHAASGSGDVYVGRGDGICIGPINPQRRTGAL